MNRRLSPVALAVAIVLLTAMSAQAQYVVIGSTSTQVGPLERTEWTVAASPDPIDNFKMTRWVKSNPIFPIRGSILFLPSLGTTFALYEQRDTYAGLGSSIAEFFALRNFDVYGYSPRFEGVPAGSCEVGAVDCSVMAGWDIQSMLDDISYVRDQIDVLQPGAGVVAGGLSLGGILAVAVANDDGARYDGVFPWEGMLLSNDPVGPGPQCRVLRRCRSPFGGRRHLRRRRQRDVQGGRPARPQPARFPEHHPPSSRPPSPATRCWCWSAACRQRVRSRCRCRTTSWWREAWPRTVSSRA